MTAKILASCLLLLGSAAAQEAAKSRPGLEAQLLNLGVTQERYPYLTASVKLTNNSSAYVFVLLFGPPSVVDDAGGTFQYSRSTPITGVANCLGRQGPGTPTPRTCVGRPMDPDFLFPVDSYTEIEPGQSATYNFTVRAAGESKGSKYTIAQEVAYRLVKPDAIEQDQNVSEKDKLKALHFGSLNLTSSPGSKEVVTSTINYNMSSIK